MIQLQMNKHGSLFQTDHSIQFVPVQNKNMVRLDRLTCRSVVSSKGFLVNVEVKCRFSRLASASLCYWTPRCCGGASGAVGGLVGGNIGPIAHISVHNCVGYVNVTAVERMNEEVAVL